MTAFDRLKEVISKSPVVKPYDISKSVQLHTDASGTAIAGVLIQDQHPVLYISRRLTAAERNYSCIEREGLAVVWSVFRLSLFLRGRSFTINTDHKPLEGIFGEGKELPSEASSRLMKWAIKLMEFDYTIKYIPGKNMSHVDALTRLSIHDDTQDVEIVSEALSMHFVEECCIPIQELLEEQEKEFLLQRITKRVKNGNWQNPSQREKLFMRNRQALTVEKNLLRFGTRFVAPESLKTRIIAHSHQTHNGIA